MNRKNRIGLILVAVLIGATTIFLSMCKKGNLSDELGVSGNAEKEAAATAQSIMIGGLDVQIADVISGTQVWHFDQHAAAIADFGYNNCNPATTGQDNGTQCRQKAEANAFAARCTYWDKSGHPYWELVHDNTDGTSSADVTFTLSVAGESWMTNRQFPTLGKYSFTLKNADGTSRVSNLAYSLDGATPVALNHTLEDASSSNGCFLEFFYTANAGTFGKDQSHLISDQTIGYILNHDDAAPNNGGCGYVTIARVDPFTVNIPLGTHTLVVTGTVKGNDGSAEVTFTRKAEVHITAQGCQIEHR